MNVLVDVGFDSLDGFFEFLHTSTAVATVIVISPVCTLVVLPSNHRTA